MTGSALEEGQRIQIVVGGIDRRENVLERAGIGPVALRFPEVPFERQLQARAIGRKQHPHTRAVRIRRVYAEDDPDADMATQAGEHVGWFSGGSIWPLVMGIGLGVGLEGFVYGAWLFSAIAQSIDPRLSESRLTVNGYPLPSSRRWCSNATTGASIGISAVRRRISAPSTT